MTPKTTYWKKFTGKTPEELYEDALKKPIQHRIPEPVDMSDDGYDAWFDQWVPRKTDEETAASDTDQGAES